MFIVGKGFKTNGGKVETPMALETESLDSLRKKPFNDQVFRKTLRPIRYFFIVRLPPQVPIGHLFLAKTPFGNRK